MTHMPDITELEKKLTSLRHEGVPSDAFRTNARIRILNSLTVTHPVRKPWYRRPTYIWYTLGTALATLILSVGTVYAAQSSFPDSKLYPLKVLSERVALTLSPTESLKTTVASTIISRRITEIEELQKRDDEPAVEASISHFTEDVASIQKREDISQEDIQRTLKEHEDVIDTFGAHDEKGQKEEDEKSGGAVKGVSSPGQPPGAKRELSGDEDD